MLAYISLGISFILICAVVFVIYAFLLPPLIGAPFVPTGKKKVQKMIALANIKKDTRTLDIGSGDGRIVIASAAAGAQANGCEINPFLVLRSRMALKSHGYQNQSSILWRSFRNMDFSGYDIITIYGLPGIMRSLETKLRTQLPVGGRVISHQFQFPNWPLYKRDGNVFVYIKEE